MIQSYNSDDMFQSVCGTVLSHPLLSHGADWSLLVPGQLPVRSGTSALDRERGGQ